MVSPERSALNILIQPAKAIIVRIMTKVNKMTMVSKKFLTLRRGNFFLMKTRLSQETWSADNGTGA
ncbi:hypothetical protein GPICK_14995 [Geobacter pickeringii]|uniref:Uncharacterized protein n=1 Tax=Geobacter pickeringii TaxID=345632 RepID=A0A0B5BCP1_9BACT|nr:hypothetical protein GPICK_14995 [Geobacter pickeringii]